MTNILVKNLNKSFESHGKSVEVLRNINISIDEGEIVAIMGKSGSGKSTLLNVLGGLLRVDSGSYQFDGNELSRLGRNQLSSFRANNIGFILQYYALLDDRTVFQNVELPLLYGRKKKDLKDTVETMLRKLDIYDKKDCYPFELSGGQCQRTAIARALINNASVILADEPTGSLDSATEVMIMEYFKQLNNEGKTIIIVTHDQSVAGYCNRVITIKDGQIN